MGLWKWNEAEMAAKKKDEEGSQDPLALLFDQPDKLSERLRQHDRRLVETLDEAMHLPHEDLGKAFDAHVRARREQVSGKVLRGILCVADNKRKGLALKILLGDYCGSWRK